MPNNIRQQATWVSTGDPETVNDSRLPQPGQLGRCVMVKQPTASAPGVESGRDKGYRYIATDSGMTVAPFRGALAFWKDKAAWQVTTAATNITALAGVFQGAITPGNYGYIQTEGPAEVKFVDAPTVVPNTAGAKAITSSTAGKADCVAGTTAVTSKLVGTVANTPTYSATESTAVVELEVPDIP